jgi:hypothetical protein
MFIRAALSHLREQDPAMRKSRVLLAGVAVAAAAAATSAFTAGNDFSGVTSNVAGYGQLEVTGADVTDIHYDVNSDDGTIVDAVEFTTTTDVTGATSTLTLKTGVTGSDPGGMVVGSPYACTVKLGSEWDNTSMVLICDTSAVTNGGTPTNFADFNGVGLTVVS